MDQFARAEKQMLLCMSCRIWCVDMEDWCLREAVVNLVTQIENYSDRVFNAREFSIDKEQAEKIAAYLIRKKLFDLDGMMGEAVDGAEIGLAFETISEYEK